MSPTTESITGNGLLLETGGYGFPELSAEAFAKVVARIPLDEKETQELKAWNQFIHTGSYGIMAGYDRKRLDQAGWGVIFAADSDPAIRDALRPLLAMRKEQAGSRYREYSGGDGYLPKDTKNTWLARPPRRTGPGPVDPDVVPYYLLIVGDPESIPFSFQIQLDYQYAVGRICFDTVQEYANYARSVVRAEKERLCLPRKATFFGTENPDDRSTASSFSGLFTPLAQSFLDRVPYGKPMWQVSQVGRSQATKARLGQALGGSETPALLFTASHGMEVRREDPAGQLRYQGALVCQNWPGPEKWKDKPLPRDFFFCGEDLRADAQLWGAVAFFYACFSVGTPLLNEFVEYAKPGAGAIAEKPFISSLPKRMLSHPGGGALAVIGHVDRAWGYSYEWSGAGRQLNVFNDTFYRLLDGEPVGAALEPFNERYGEILTELSEVLQEIKFTRDPDWLQLANLWTATNDAKNYVIFGDPAVRVMV